VVIYTCGRAENVSMRKSKNHQTDEETTRKAAFSSEGQKKGVCSLGRPNRKGMGKRLLYDFPLNAHKYDENTAPFPVFTR